MEPTSETLLLPNQKRHSRKEFRRKAVGISCVLVWVTFLCVVILTVAIVVGNLNTDRLPDDPEARAAALLSQHPVIDG